MKAVITVTGKDKVGIIAMASAMCAKYGANIVDISQTVLDGYFAMIMLVDLTDCAMPFHELSQYLADKGRERALDVHIQRQDIFEAMHKI